MIIEGRSSLYAVVSTVESELAAVAKCSFHLMILSSDEKSVCLPSKDFKFVEGFIFVCFSFFSSLRIEPPRPCLLVSSVVFSASSAFSSHHVSIAFLQAFLDSVFISL